MKGKLIIVSNRLPVNITRENGKVIIKPSSGGLVSAMNSFLESADMNADKFEKVIWIGYAGSTEPDWRKSAGDMKNDRYSFIPVFIAAKTYSSYYNGLSNSTVWPLFHYFPSFTEFEEKDYEAYKIANNAFADVVAANAAKEDLIWIHDYHLMLCPGIVRRLMPEASIGFFLHIPFPSYEIFRILPKQWREDLLHGLAGADLIGFHTNDYVMHFIKSMQMIIGFGDEMRYINYNNRMLKTEVFPISIDFKKYNDAFDAPGTITKRNELKELFKGKKILFSVDRLDYTKGVLNRLKAYNRFLKSHPEYLEKIVFILVTIPTRDAISRYSERKKMINEYVGFLNGKHATMTWQPVIYRYTNLSFDELMSLYTACDIALITPLRDGMNLVAKEFVASRKDKNGVLILSEMAGAVSELGEAVVINPMDESDVSEKILQSLEMLPGEQSRRLEHMRTRIQNYDVNHWAMDFIRQLKQIKEFQQRSHGKLISEEEKNKIKSGYNQSSARLLLLDYDGTLVHFARHPQEAIPTSKVLSVLKDLCNDPRNTVFIISGRDNDTLNSWFGHLPLNWVAEHGALIKYSGKDVYMRNELNNEWQEKANEIMQSYCRRCVNTFVEQKEFSIAWHYRNADKELSALRAKELYNELNGVFRNMGLQVIHGNKLLEIRHLGTDKGAVVKDILSLKNYDFIFAVGDDRTDEDMFKVLENHDAWTIRIGDAVSSAKYHLSDPDKMLKLLEELINHSKKVVASTD